MGSLTREGRSKIHIVCVPYPAQGHIKPMFSLAKLLHSKGFHITYVNTEYNHTRFMRAQGHNSVDGLEHFKFEAIPDALPPCDNTDVTQDIPTLSHAVMNYFLEPFKKLLHRLSKSIDSPPVTFILSDIVMPFTLDAAQEMGISLVWLWTASVCGFVGYSQYRTLLNKGIIPFQDSSYLIDGSLDKILDWVPPSIQGISLKYIPSFIKTTNKDDVMFNFLMTSLERTAQSSAPVIFNSFDAFEQDVLEQSSKLISGPCYSIGPLQLQLQKLSQDAPENSLGCNLWKEDSKCLEWLDLRSDKSVVYVSFGSITTMSNENLVEFAWGLANSKHPFLWILRPDLVSGDSAVLTAEFLTETKDRGLISSWCDQETVLSHPSVGAFLTHCGWNSTLDTICGGVPILCWPFFAEQQINCWFSFKKWGIGMEIDSDVNRGEVEGQVKELMEGEKGKEMRKKAEEFKKLAQEATVSSSGSSSLDFDKVINEVFLRQKDYKK